MNRRLFQFATLLPWLALPFVALEYRLAWHQLPAHMATHFNAANQPNGWMSRQQSLDFILWMLAIALTIGTLLLTAKTWRTVDPLSWALLGLFALLVGFLVAVNHAILSFNLHGSAVHPERMAGMLALAVVALIALYLVSNRHAPLPDGETFVIETHSGGLWSTLILLALIGPILGIALAPGRIPWPLIPVGVIGLGAFAMAWSGFQYRFQHHGVEISTLGFRLRSIPRSAIVGYSVEPWAFIRGYGIRGMGRTRAYVWCNKVVHIKTTNGEVYLGHNDPERIVRDLDQMMGSETRVQTGFRF